MHMQYDKHLRWWNERARAPPSAPRAGAQPRLLGPREPELAGLAPVAAVSAARGLESTHAAQAGAWCLVPGAIESRGKLLRKMASLTDSSIGEERRAGAKALP
jgi:hypothetical protein